MKKIFLLLVFLLPMLCCMTSAAVLRVNATYTETQSGGNTTNGVLFVAKQGLLLHNITKHPSDTNLFCIVISYDSNVSLATGTFIGNNCQVDLLLKAGSTYRIGTNSSVISQTSALNSTAAFNPRFPMVTSYGNFTGGYFGNQNNISNMFNTVNSTIYSIQNITSFQKEVGLNHPSNSSIVVSKLFNFSLVSEFNITNATVSLWNSSNTLINTTFLSLSGTSQNLTVNLSNLNTIGNYKWNVLLCDNSSLSCISGINNLSFIYGATITNITYNTSIFESDVASFMANITVPSAASLSQVYLIYNNTQYVSSLTYLGGDFYSATNNVTVPNVAVSTLNSFYYRYVFSGDVEHNSSNYNQTVNPLQSIQVSTSCGAGLFPALFFNFATEVNLSSMNSSVSYNFQYGVQNTTSKITSGNLTNINGFYVCTNQTSVNYTLGYGEVQYGAAGFVDRRYYLFSGSRLGINQINTTLYDLDNSQASSFLFEATDSSLTAYDSIFLAILRWYPSTNEYRTVEIAKTDDQGKTVMKVETEDVDYRVALYYQNGSLIRLLTPIRFVCLEQPCSYTIRVSPSNDYTTFLNIQHRLTFNYTTKVFTLTWNDPSQQTTTMNLTIYKDTGTTSYGVCSTIASGFTGILTCNVSLYTGRLRAEAYRSASPPLIITQSIVNIIDSAFTSSFGLWLSLLIGIPVIMLFAFISPIAALVGGVVALIPALYFGSVNITIVGGIAILAGIIAHFIKRVG